MSCPLYGRFQHPPLLSVRLWTQWPVIPRALSRPAPRVPRPVSMAQHSTKDTTEPSNAARARQVRSCAGHRPAGSPAAESVPLEAICHGRVAFLRLIP